MLLPVCAYAGPRTSASYSVITDAADSGGQRVASAAYNNVGSIGGITGTATVAAPAETIKSGYAGQLFEATGLQLAAAPPAVNEGSTRQLGSALLLDDLTTLALPASAVAWSIVTGPLSSISTDGLATAGNVFQDSAATAQGSYAGISGILGLTVLNSVADNFGTYGGDLMADDWQVQFFGQDNANAGPLLDPDNDGQDNLFEYRAGLIPTDANSLFQWNITPSGGNPGLHQISFSPRLPGRTYTVRSSTDLSSGSWEPLSGAITTDNGDQRTVLDPDELSARKFYRVEITLP